MLVTGCLATVLVGCSRYVASSCPWDSSVRIEKVVVDPQEPSATVYGKDEHGKEVQTTFSLDEQKHRLLKNGTPIKFRFEDNDPEANSAGGRWSRLVTPTVGE